MSLARTLVRGVLLGLSTAALTTVWLVGLWPAHALGRAEAWRGGVFRAWGRSAARVLGMRVRVRGEAPRAPFLLVTNHLGYVDIVLIASTTPCVFVSKAEVRDWPVVGWLARAMQTLFVDRTRRADVTRVAAQIEERLRRGQGVVVFPEGTSTGGEVVLPFRSSLLDPAARGRWPVRHAAIRYETPPGAPPASEAVCWWGDMTFGPHVLRLMGLRRFDACIAFGAEPIRDADRKSLAQRLHAAIQADLPSLPRETTMSETSCKAALEALLRQCLELVERLGSEVPDLYRAAPELPGSGVTSGAGAHVRHLTDACQCLLDGVEGGVVDYDARRRDARVEAEAEAGAERLRALIEDVRHARLPPSAELRVLAEGGRSGAAGERPDHPSSVGRELEYVRSHTVHHCAMIALVLRQLGVDPGAELGVAPSTLAFWEETKRCAPLAG